MLASAGTLCRMDDWRSYDRTAVTYEKVHAPRFAEPARDLAALAGVTAGSKVLDVGTGTGVVAQVAQELGATAVGVDPSEGMLDVARSTRPGIEFLAAQAIDLPFVDGRFDVVLGNFVLAHFVEGRDRVVRHHAGDAAGRRDRLHDLDRRARRVHRRLARARVDRRARRPARTDPGQGDPEPRPVHTARRRRGDPARRGAPARADRAEAVRVALRPRRVRRRAHRVGDGAIRPRDAR